MFHAECVFLGLGIKNINKTLDCPLIFLVTDVFLNVYARATSSPDKNFFIKTAFIFLYFRISAIDIICINAMRIFGRGSRFYKNNMDNFQKLIQGCDENFIFFTEKLKKLRITLNLYDEFVKLIGQESNELINLKRTINYSSYIAISFLELSVTLKNLVLAKTDWEKIFFIKNSYLTIHETLKLLRPEKNCTTILDENIKSTKDKELKSNLDKCNAKITNFRNNKNYQLIENVRHYVTGHINPSLKKYYDTIFNLDGQQAVLITKDFMDILSDILILSQKTESQLLLNYKEQSQDIESQLKEAKAKFEELKKNVG